MVATHPAPEQLRSFLLGKLEPAECERIANHLDACPECQAAIGAFDAEVDTLVAQLHGAADQTIAVEPQLRKALEFVKRFGKDASATTRAADPESLGELREYRLVKKLGEGGMGAVFKAIHTRLNKVVAIKVLPRDKMQAPGAIARFEREMLAVGNLDHPHLIRAHDAGEVDGVHFLVMEYVAGQDLSQLVKEGGALPIADACEVVRQAALGLAEAHRHGLVHRDVKPSNLMLTDKGQVKVLDLGLALLAGEGAAHDLTSTGQMMGTVDYMAPEQGGDSHKVDARADIYSLGATLYKLLTGEPPFSGPKYDTLMRKLLALSQDIPVPVHEKRTEIPDALSQIVARMLAKDPTQRFANAAEVAAALMPFTAGTNLASDRGAVSTMTTADPGSVSSAEMETLMSTSRAPSKTSLPIKPLLSADSGSKQGWMVAVAGGLIGGLALVFAAIFFLQTPHGTLRVEINDPTIEVGVVGTNVVLKQPDKDAITLAPGQRTLLVKRGDLEFTTEKFLLKKGEETTIKVELLPGEVRVVTAEKIPLGSQKIEPIPVKPATTDIDREIAKWFLATPEDGKYLFAKPASGKEWTLARQVDVLPTEPFAVVEMTFNSAANFSDEDLARVATLPTLDYLVMSAPQGLTEKGLQQLTKFPALGRLTLTATPIINDQSVESLARISKLTVLGIDRTPVTDVGLAKLQSLSQLSNLSLTGTQVTEAGVKQFAAARPNCKIHWDGGTVEPHSLTLTAPVEKPIVLMREGKRVREFKNLAGATSETKPGDVIDIYSAGPVRLEPGYSKPLHIRGAGGFRPRLEPAITRGAFGSPVTLEHCDLIMAGVTSLEIADTALTLKNCRVLGSISLYGPKSKFVAQDSLLLSPGGGVGVNSQQPGAQIRLENCILRSGNSPIIVVAPEVNIELHNNTIYDQSGYGSTLISGDEKAQVQVVAEGNIIHHRSQAQIFGLPNWRKQVTWKGKNNLYSGNLFVVLNDKQEFERWANLEDWNKLWGQAEEGSKFTEQFQPLFVRSMQMPVPELRAIAEPYIEAARQQGKLPELGCNWDLVGPGEGYVNALKSIQGAAPVLRPEVSDAGPIALLRAGKEIASYRSVVEAVNAAQDRDVIEIRTDETLPVVQVEGEQKRFLTLRAGAGYTPVLQGLGSLSRDVWNLEGLAFTGDVNIRTKGGRGGVHRFTNCTMLPTPFIFDQTWVFVPDGDIPPAVVNSRLGLLRPMVAKEVQLRIENSVLSVLWGVGDMEGPDFAQAELLNCVFWSPEPLRESSVCVTGKARFSVRNCYVASSETLLYGGQLGAFEPPFAWQGKHNFFANGLQNYVSGMGIAFTLEQWRKFVAQEEGSSEALPPLFNAKPWKLVPGTSGAGDGKDGQDRGADITKVGTPSPSL